MVDFLRRSWAVVDLDCIDYNIRSIKQKLKPGCMIMGVVKADAYGHGDKYIADELVRLGVNWFAVSNLTEAMSLRNQGIYHPILILGTTPPNKAKQLCEYNITQAVFSLEYAKKLQQQAQRAGVTVACHIKVDTGMSRLGYLCDGDYFENGVEGICEGCSLPGLDAEGIFTHFAVSDEPGEQCHAYTEHQFQLFTDVIKQVEDRLGRPFRIRHCANTGAVARYPETCLDMVRPGLLLYGYGEFAEELNLKPVMSLKTTVSTIKIYPSGTAISYGGIYVTPHKTRIGVIPYGYADGFFRCLSNKCSIMTSEGPAPQRGKICMDMCMIDLTDKMGVDVGSEVEIFGKQNSINDLAALAGTIPYELTCAVSKRVPRIYYRDGKVIEKELLLRG